MTAEISVTLAVLITLFASAMWGSWMQIIKLCPNYPLHGVVFTIYSVSFVLLSCAAFIGRRIFFPMGLTYFIQENLPEILQIALGGAAAAVGVLVSLQLMRNSGLVVGTAVSGAAGSITGVLIAVAKEGLPDVAFASIALVVCTAVIVLAGVLCSCASFFNKRSSSEKKTGVQNIFLLIAFVVLSNGYIYGTSTGTKAGIPPFLVCLCLCAGAFSVTLMLSGTALTIERRWREALCVRTSKLPLLFGTVAAVFHYGGNLLSIICMPALSATLSFLIGRSANIWTFFFGIHLGEFKGAGRKVKILLASGILLYVVGILLIALWFY